ncbi:MAG: hypothetical protein GWN00_10590, partial [Aliifodinibius sp.]|nr:hypothetical protein [Fodinibius sp.]NIV11624.1 hypothetical protein [Fodinibius sp.]NIY25235.1 hypothetical protein [Fodinibius sp.]
MATVREEKTKIINKALLRMRHPGFSSTDLDFDTPSNNTGRIEKLVVDTFDDIVEEILEMVPWVHMSTIDDTLTQDDNY